MINACLTEDDVCSLEQNCKERPVMLFKHSTRCPISAAARREFEQFAAATPEVECWEVLVIEQRPLSQRLAADINVTHTSPQAILLVDGKAVWDTSHWSITRDRLCEALNKCRG